MKKSKIALISLLAIAQTAVAEANELEYDRTIIREGELEIGYQKIFLDESIRRDTDRFGSAMAVSGRTLAVGVGEAYGVLGAVYIYEPAAETGWILAQTIFGPSGESYLGASDFGVSVDIDGDTMVVGAPGDQSEGETERGSLFVYIREADGLWVQSARLKAGEASRDVGQVVSIHGDIIMARARPSNPALSPWRSEVVVFERLDTGEWVKADVLPKEWDDNLSNSFGDSLSVFGNGALIGDEYSKNEDQLLTGAVYVYERQADRTWERKEKLVPSDGIFRHNFGQSLDLQGNLAVIGAPMGDSFEGGKAYIFKRGAEGAWAEHQILLPFDEPLGSYQGTFVFGTSVAFSGNGILVGSPDFPRWVEGEFLRRSGKAFLFVENDNGQFLPRLDFYMPNDVSDWRFSETLVMTEEVAFVGMPRDRMGSRAGVASVGSAFAFDISELVDPVNRVDPVVPINPATWFSDAAEIEPAGWRYFDWFKGFKPEGPNWIFHGRHGWLYVLADDTSGMFLWDVALSRWMFTTETTYPWMYAYGPSEGWVFFFEDGRPGARFFKRGDNGEVVSEQNLAGDL